jgi:hypothetical protein
MGLFLKLRLFLHTDPEALHSVYRSIHESLRLPLRDHGDEEYSHTLHAPSGPWTAIFEGRGWDWEHRRTVQQAASKALDCVSLCCFVYDGDFWGYELVDRGQPVDQFLLLSDPDDHGHWFPNRPTHGDPAALASRLDFLAPDDVAPYLVRIPPYPITNARIGTAPWRSSWDEYDAARNALDVPPRPGDEFTRFAECAALNFLRLLHLDIFLGPDPDGRSSGGVVQLRAPILHRFWPPKLPRR